MTNKILIELKTNELYKKTTENLSEEEKALIYKEIVNFCNSMNLSIDFFEEILKSKEILTELYKNYNKR